MILLNPGPANTTESVKQALVCPDICPRERAFGELLNQTRHDLTRVVHQGNDYTTVIFGGSGTAAVEAALCSTVPADENQGRLLVIDNGAYGARMAQIAEAYLMPHRVVGFGVGGYPDLGRIKETLDGARYSHLAVVHHETTTGMLNPVDEIAALCAEREIEVIVDAMSSFAGLPIDIAKMGATYLIASSNKCIQGIAGLSFVVAHRPSLDRLEPIPGRSVYLNLLQQHRFFESKGEMRYTPPVQIVHALAQALKEHFAEGQQSRYERYLDCFHTLDRGLRQLGFRRLLPEQMLSRILTAYIEPDHPRYRYDEMHDLLFERGYTIYPGKGAKEATFRLANMGAITADDMRGFVSALAEVIDQMGLTPLYSGC